jgi:GNAT superfamily N-acetyltransferase
MDDEEHSLTAALVVVAPIDPADSMAQQCLHAYVAELNSRFDSGFDPSRSISAAEDELRPPDGLFLVASLRERPIGCGALKFHGVEPAEIKRMWVDSSVRGLGIGRRLLTELEKHAAGNGACIVRLETNGTLAEAIALYRSAGYVEVAPFNDEPYAHHWFEKRLQPPATLLDPQPAWWWLRRSRDPTATDLRTREFVGTAAAILRDERPRPRS